MKAKIKIYCTGKYGKCGEQIVELKKVEYFKNGKVNQAATLRNGYNVIETITAPYGYGIQQASIVEIIGEAKRS